MEISQWCYVLRLKAFQNGCNSADFSIAGLQRRTFSMIIINSLKSPTKCPNCCSRRRDGGSRQFQEHHSDFQPHFQADEPFIRSRSHALTQADAISPLLQMSKIHLLK